VKSRFEILLHLVVQAGELTENAQFREIDSTTKWKLDGSTCDENGNRAFLLDRTAHNVPYLDNRLKIGPRALTSLLGANEGFRDGFNKVFNLASSDVREFDGNEPFNQFAVAVVGAVVGDHDLIS